MVPGHCAWNNSCQQRGQWTGARIIMAENTWQSMRAEPLPNTQGFVEAAVISSWLSASTLQNSDTKHLLRGFSATVSSLPTTAWRGRHCWMVPAPLCLGKSFLCSCRQQNLSLNSQTVKGLSSYHFHNRQSLCHCAVLPKGYSSLKN